MKLVIGSYVLDGVSSTAYEQFITYYQNTPASYITNQDIERWNTPADLSDLASKSYVIDKIGAIPAPDLSAYATISYVTEEIEKNEKVIASAVSYVNDKIDSIEMPDLSSYATQSYVTDQINSISFDVDTTGLVNESRLQDYVSGAIAAHGSSAYTSLQNYTNQKISDLNISSYATKDWVTEHITEIASGGTISLDGYATELWVNNQGFLKQENLAGYVTNPIMAAALNAYMKKSDMTTYATKNYVDNAILQAATGEVDLSMYALKSEIPSLSNYYNKQYIDQNLASKSYVTAKVVEIASGGEITLDGYATETWATNHFLGTNALNNYYTKSQVDAKIPSLTNYITFDWIEGYYNQYVKDYCDTFNTDGTNLLNYVSKQELASLGYITEHQDLTPYATQSYVTSEISNVLSYIEDNEKVTAAAISYVNELAQNINSIVIPEVDTSNFISYDYLASLGYATNSYVTDKFAEDESVWAAALTDINTRMGSYVTSDALSQMGYITQHQTIDLSSYVTKSDINNYGYISWKNMNPGAYTGNITLYRSGLFINENSGNITPTVFSYEQIASSGRYNWVSSGSLKNYVSGVLSSYATISYVSENLIEVEKAVASAVSYVNDKVSNIDLSDYATQTYVMDKINSIEANGGVDLSSYALKSELPFVCYNGAYILSYSYNNRASDSWEVGEGSVVIFKHSLNYNTKTGTGAVAIGDRVTALGQHSLAIGNQASTNANWSIASGFASQARGESSIALGRYVKTYDTGSAAVGMYNNATQGVSLFTVGDGTTNDARHNALEITLNGYSYISKPCISYNSGWSEISYETWSFTLQDNSVVTKKILMF